MAVISPVVTVTDIQRNTSSLTSGSDALANAWGTLYDITVPDSVIHTEVLILHSPDDGSSTWDTDTYTIEFTATDNSQTKGSWLITKSFNDHDIPIQTTTWTGTETMNFDSGDLDNDPDDHMQAVTGVAVLADSEYETDSNDIFGAKVMIIDAMPKVTTSSEPTSFVFADDEFTFDSGDAGQTVSVTSAHENLPTGGTYAELFNSSGVSQTIYTSNPFSVTLTNTYYIHLYIDMPYDDDATDIAVRRIDITQNP